MVAGEYKILMLVLNKGKNIVTLMALSKGCWHVPVDLATWRRKGWKSEVHPTQYSKASILKHILKLNKMTLEEEV